PQKPPQGPPDEVEKSGRPPAPDPRLGGQRGVPVGTRQEVGHAPVAPMDEGRPEAPDGPGHLHRLVNGLVHEPAPTATEEPELPVRIKAAVTHPAPPEDVPPRHPVPVRALTRAPEHGADLLSELRGDLLVRVHREDPVAGRLLEGEVLLGGEPGPRPDPDAVGELARDLARLVTGLGVHHDELVGPGQALEAGPEPLFLVEGDDDRGDAPAGHFSGGREAGGLGGWPDTGATRLCSSYRLSFHRRPRGRWPRRVAWHRRAPAVFLISPFIPPAAARPVASAGGLTQARPGCVPHIAFHSTGGCEAGGLGGWPDTGATRLCSSCRLSFHRRLRGRCGRPVA